MNYLTKPAAAPPCWGAKYQDGDLECKQCKYSDTCRETVLQRIVNPQAQRTNLPVLRSYAPHPAPPPPPSISFSAQPQNTVVPLPAKPYYPPPVSSLPTPPKNVPFPSAPSSTTAPHVAPQAHQAQQYYQSSTGWSLPSNSNPNPMAPMFRPGAPAPAYYFTQYPGESVASRVGKNLLLRAAEAIFGELMQFFRHWTWPPK